MCSLVETSLNFPDIRQVIPGWDVFISFYFPHQDLLTCHSISAADTQYLQNIRCWGDSACFQFWLSATAPRKENSDSTANKLAFYLLSFHKAPIQLLDFCQWKCLHSSHQRVRAKWVLTGYLLLRTFALFSTVMLTFNHILQSCVHMQFMNAFPVSAGEKALMALTHSHGIFTRVTEYLLYFLT